VERTVLTGASVSLTRSRVFVATTVTGSSVTAALEGGALAGSALCAWAQETAPAFINAMVDTPISSACALRVQQPMTAPPRSARCDFLEISLAGGRESGGLAGCWPRGHGPDIPMSRPPRVQVLLLVLIPYYQSQDELLQVKIVQRYRT
jgi:hypothetical protein